MMKLIAVSLITLAVISLLAGCAAPESGNPPIANTTQAVEMSSNPSLVPTPTTTTPSTTTTSQALPSDFEVKGTVEAVDFAYDSQKIENGVFTGTGTDVHGYHGDLEGELTIKFTAVHDISGTSYTKVGEATFRGTVNGKHGTFTATENSSGQAFSPGCAVVDCRYTIISGTSELSDLRGTILTSESVDAPNLTGAYSGVLAFGFEPTRLPAPPPPAQPPEPKPTPTAPNPATEVNGTIELTERVDKSPPVIENGIVTSDRTDTWAVEGTLTGTWVRQVSSEIDLSSGKITSEAESTFTGTVNGRQGTFTATEVGTGQTIPPGSGDFKVEATVTGGTLELTDLSGTISFNVHYEPDVQTGTYTTALSFGEAGASYTWQEAINHISEEATVTGPIVDYLDLRDTGAGDDYVLGMGVAPLEPGAFNIRLMVDRDTLPEDLYIGKTISVTGKIIPNPFGGAAMWITDLSHIMVVEE